MGTRDPKFPTPTRGFADKSQTEIKIQKRKIKPVPRPVPEETDVIIFGQKFPKDTVKDWNDIKKEKTLGSGQFGIVYKGFLHLNKYTR